jgi:hypothetical protein
MMNTLKMRAGLIAVERLGRPEKQAVDGFFVAPEETNSIGIVRFAAEDAQELLGKKVLFGSKREEVRVLGVDFIFMEKDNVFAEIQEADAQVLAVEAAS